MYLMITVITISGAVISLFDICYSKFKRNFIHFICFDWSSLFLIHLFFSFQFLFPLSCFSFFSIFFSVFTISSPISAFLHSVFWNRFLTSTLSPCFNIQIPLAPNTYGKKWILQTAFKLNIIILKSQFYIPSFSFFYSIFILFYVFSFILL